MPAECSLEVRESVFIVIIHLGHVLNQLRLRLAVASQPVLVNQTIAVIIIAIHVVLIQTIIAILIYCIYGSVVDIIVGSGITCIAHAREEGPCCTQRGAPLILEIAIQIHAITAWIWFLVNIWYRGDSCDSVVSQVLPPSGSRAVLPGRWSAIDLSIVPVTIHI